MNTVFIVSVCILFAVGIILSGVFLKLKIVSLVLFLIFTALIILYLVLRPNKQSDKFVKISRTMPYDIPVVKAVSLSVKYIPRNVFFSHCDIDAIPKETIRHINKYCKDYTVEIFGESKCDDFLYDNYGPDSVQLYRELTGASKVNFWCYSVLYIRGGYYFDIQTKFDEHLDTLFSTRNDNIWYTTLSSEKNYNMFVVTPPFNPIIWQALEDIYKSTNIKTRPQPLNVIIQRNCPDTLEPGMNKESNGWSCILFEMTCDDLECVAKYDQHTIKSSTVMTDKPSCPIMRLDYEHFKMDPIDVDKIDLPIIYINMDSAKERRQFMETQFKDLGVEITRIPGVEVTRQDISDLGLPRTSSISEVGCFLAHINAMKEIVEKKIPRALILEDDASLYMSSRWTQKMSELNYPCWLSQGCTAYIMDIDTAKDICSETSKNFPIIPVDIYICERYGQNPMNTWGKFKYQAWPYYYYIYPYSSNFFSQIQNSTTKQMKSDSKRALNIILKCMRSRNLLKIEPDGTTVSEREEAYKVIAINNEISDIDIYNILKKYKDDKLEIYLPTIRQPLSIKQHPHKIFQLSKSNIDSTNPMINGFYINLEISNKFLNLYGDMYEGELTPGITTIITTAPQPSIPSPNLILETIKSLDKVPYFKKSLVIIGFDGCIVNETNLDIKCKTQFSCSDYDKYKQNVKKAAIKLIPNVQFVEMPYRACLSSLLYSCMKNVKTTCVNVMQQDLPIIRSFDAEKITSIVHKRPDFDLVRYSRNNNLHHEKWTSENCKSLLKSVTINIENLNFTRCSSWSDNNHIATIEHYKNIVWPLCTPLSFMEHQLTCYPIEHGYNRIWYLGDINDGDYIAHTDGRNTTVS